MYENLTVESIDTLSTILHNIYNGYSYIYGNLACSNKKRTLPCTGQESYLNFFADEVDNTFYMKPIKS